MKEILGERRVPLSHGQLKLYHQQHREVATPGGPYGVPGVPGVPRAAPSPARATSASHALISALSGDLGAPVMRTVLLGAAPCYLDAADAGRDPLAKSALGHHSRAAPHEPPSVLPASATPFLRTIVPNFRGHGASSAAGAAPLSSSSSASVSHALLSGYVTPSVSPSRLRAPPPSEGASSDRLRHEVSRLLSRSSPSGGYATEVRSLSGTGETVGAHARYAAATRLGAGEPLHGHGVNGGSSSYVRGNLAGAFAAAY